MYDSGSQACPPTKRKGAAGKEQQLANARMRKQQVTTQKELLAQLLECEGIKNPIPTHMQLLELCRIADVSTTEMREFGGFRYDIVKEARKLYADDISKKPGFSQEEVDLHEVCPCWSATSVCLLASWGGNEKERDESFTMFRMFSCDIAQR